MTHPATLPIADLEAWDWMGELERQERDRMWLAKRTGVNYRRVYRYAAGEQTPPRAWLVDVARVLGMTLAGDPVGQGGSDR